MTTQMPNPNKTQSFSDGVAEGIEKGLRAFKRFSFLKKTIIIVAAVTVMAAAGWSYGQIYGGKSSGPGSGFSNPKGSAAWNQKVTDSGYAVLAGDRSVIESYNDVLIPLSAHDPEEVVGMMSLVESLEVDGCATYPLVSISLAESGDFKIVATSHILEDFDSDQDPVLVSQLWDMVEKPVEDGGGVMHDGPIQSGEVLTKQNQSLVVMGSLFDDQPSARFELVVVNNDTSETQAMKVQVPVNC